MVGNLIDDMHGTPQSRMCIAKLLVQPWDAVNLNLYNNPHFCAGFDVGVGAVQILIFLVGTAAVGVGKHAVTDNNK